MSDPDHAPPFGGEEVAPCSLEQARVAVLPLCFESAPSFGHGAADGPGHILRCSAELEALDEETGVEWASLPIHTLAPVRPPEGDPEGAVRLMEQAAQPAVDRGCFLLGLGGDHLVTLGPLRAIARRHPDVGVLQIDAHPDLRDRWNGSRFNHACIMRRIVDDLHLPVAQAGMRTLSPEERDYIREKGLDPIFSHRIDPGNDGWIETVLQRLPDKVYMTFDLDGLDPSVLPGTGTPEPDGLTFRQAVSLIRAVGREKQVVGADICELMKIPGSLVSEFTAAKLAMKMLVHFAAAPDGPPA